MDRYVSKKKTVTSSRSFSYTTNTNYWSPLIQTQEHNTRTRVLNGTLASGISDTGASSSCAPPTETALLHTNQQSHKRFQVPTGEVVPATDQALIHHKLRGAARQVAIVPGIKTNTLLSTGKMAGENYTAIYDKNNAISMMVTPPTLPSPKKKC